MKPSKNIGLSVVSGSRPKVNEQQAIRKMSVVSIAGNTALSGLKFAAGIFGHSGAMISDAVHSFSDVLTTVSAAIGTRLSLRPADQDHPYGHDRIESVAAIFLGQLLLFTGFMIGKTGLETIFSGQYETLQVPGMIALLAALISILTKEAMFWYTRHYARLIHSAAFMADAWHHRSDALSSIGSLVGIGGAMLGFPIMDSIASVVICLFILKVSWDILKDAISKILDTSCGQGYEQQMKEFIESQDNVVCVDLLRTRMFGSQIYVDSEIQVDGTMSLFQSHEVADTVHNLVESTYPNIKHIMIHVNPGTPRPNE